MAIDINTEELLSLTQATKELPKLGKRPSVSTLWRWCRVGINGVTMEYLRLGRKIVTSREAMARFFTKLAEMDPPRHRPNLEYLKPQRRRTARQRQRSIDQANAILAEAGI